MGLTDFVKAIIKRETKVQSFNAEVLEVNESEGTCNVLVEEGLELFDVRLQSVVDDIKSPCLILPKKGSIVMCSIIQNDSNEAYISKVSEVDKYLFVVEDYSLKLDKEGVEINGGSFGGLVKVNELVAELNKNNQLLTAIKTVLDGAPIPEAGNSAPSSLQAALKAATSTLTVGDFTKIENTKVTH